MTICAAEIGMPWMCLVTHSGPNDTQFQCYVERYICFRLSVRLYIGCKERSIFLLLHRRHTRISSPAVRYEQPGPCPLRWSGPSIPQHRRLLKSSRHQRSLEDEISNKLLGVLICVLELIYDETTTIPLKPKNEYTTDPASCSNLKW